jgi:hypothetical protein
MLRQCYAIVEKMQHLSYFACMVSQIDGFIFYNKDQVRKQGARSSTEMLTDKKRGGESWLLEKLTGTQRIGHIV